MHDSVAVLHYQTPLCQAADVQINQLKKGRAQRKQAQGMFVVSAARPVSKILERGRLEPSEGCSNLKTVSKGMWIARGSGFEDMPEV